MTAALVKKERELGHARTDLRNAAKRFTAVANNRRFSAESVSFENAADGLERAARAFFRAEEAVMQIKHPGPRPVDGGTT